MSDKKTSKDAERDLLAPVSFDEFEKPTYERWQAEVEKALKGGDFHKKMFTKTYEGITLQPIYTPALHGEKIPKETLSEWRLHTLRAVQMSLSSN